MLNRVRHTLQALSLFAPHRTLVVAVSGGPDSLCLLHLLWRLRDEGGPALHVAHLDHRFRGDESAAEARFVAHTASAWDLPATVAQADVAAIAHDQHQNKQAAARTARYAFLARVAAEVGADGVAVAHHADDQAETVLLHLLRGAGPAGLRGMRLCVPWHEWGSDTAPPPPAPKDPAPPLVRPLLYTTRAEIEDYCAEHYLDPRHDPSNAAQYYTRNRIRADLLPHMAQYNQQIVAALGRTAQVCADDYAYIQAQLDALWQTPFVTEQAGVVRFDQATWGTLPVSLQRYALRRAARLLSGSDDLAYDLVEAGRHAATQGTGHQQALGRGLFLRVEYGTILVLAGDPHSTTLAGDSSPPQLTADEHLLAVPGVTPLSEAWAVVCTFAPPDDRPREGRWRWWVALDADQIGATLLLRRRRAGDRFRPAGKPGSRSLQDFFVDQKVPQPARAAWPILATPDAVVWVAGLRADERFHATPETQRHLWVVLRRRG